jgi:hypothetical protein
MKTINLIITGFAVMFIIHSCSGDKQAQLAKLKQQQTNLSDKINNLENELRSEQKDPVNPEKFKFVGITDVKTSRFDHYIRVQGK